MNRFKRWTALVVVLLCALAPQALAQKITVDPNTVKQTEETEEQSQKTDLRLAQLVTYEAKRKTVLAILDELSEKTGVAMKAGQNSKDWQVRDRKMCVFAKDLPLAALMSSMARVMKFKWSREGEPGAYSYRLYMDRKTLLDAESKLQREEERIKNEQARKREDTFKQLTDAANMTPEELEKLRDTSPFVYMATKSGIAQSLGSFFGQVPAAAEALASGQEMSLNAGMLPPSAQQSLFQSMRDIQKLGATLGDKSEFPEEVVGNPSLVNIGINSHMEEMRGRPEAGFILGMISFRAGSRNFDIPLIDPESSMAKTIGKLVLRSMDEGKPINEIAKEAQSEFMQAFLADMKHVDTGEKPVEHPDEPELHENVRLEPKSPRQEDLEAALAEASKLAVVSDYFGNSMMMPMGRVGTQEGELKTVLEKIGDTLRYNWEKHGDVIELRSKDWYRKRAAQIPEAWLDAWRKTLKDTGTLDLGDLSQIAMLDMDQMTTNIMDDPMFMASGILGVIYPNREILRLYAGMSQSQQAALFGENGLDLRTLSPEQWKQVEKLIMARNIEFLQNPEARIIVAGTRKPKDKQFEYTFTVTCMDVDTPVEWKLTTPSYKEPPKEEPKPADAAKAAEPAKPAEDPDKPK